MTNRPITSEELELVGDAIDCSASCAWIKETPPPNENGNEDGKLIRPEKDASNKEGPGAAPDKEGPGAQVEAASPGEVIPEEVAFQPLDTQSFSTFGGGGVASVANTRPLAAKNPISQKEDDSASITTESL